MIERRRASAAGNWPWSKQRAYLLQRVERQRRNGLGGGVPESDKAERQNASTERVPDPQWAERWRRRSSEDGGGERRRHGSFSA